MPGFSRILDFHFLFQNGKSDNCDKTCENTSETAPCSTSVGSMEGSDPVLPALLLQNGHPPPLTRPEESTTHTEDDKETIISTSTDSNQKVSHDSFVILNLIQLRFSINCNYYF